MLATEAHYEKYKNMNPFHTWRDGFLYIYYHTKAYHGVVPCGFLCKKNSTVLYGTTYDITVQNWSGLTVQYFFNARTFRERWTSHKSWSICHCFKSSSFLDVRVVNGSMYFKSWSLCPCVQWCLLFFLERVENEPFWPFKIIFSTTIVYCRKKLYYVVEFSTIPKAEQLYYYMILLYIWYKHFLFFFRQRNTINFCYIFLRRNSTRGFLWFLFVRSDEEGCHKKIICLPVGFWALSLSFFRMKRVWESESAR